MSRDDLGPFLGATETLLRDKVLSAVDGDARFAGLMVASALGIARREIALADRLQAAGTEVSASVAAMRAGRFDGNEGLYRQLLKQAALRTAVTRPQALRPEEKALAGLA